MNKEEIEDKIKKIGFKELTRSYIYSISDNSFIIINKSYLDDEKTLLDYLGKILFSKNLPIDKKVMLNKVIQSIIES